MDGKLLLGDLSFSSWSMRAGLLRDRFNLPLKEELVPFLGASVAQQVAKFAPARTVPVLLWDDGTVVWRRPGTGLRGAAVVGGPADELVFGGSMVWHWKS